MSLLSYASSASLVLASLGAMSDAAAGEAPVPETSARPRAARTWAPRDHADLSIHAGLGTVLTEGLSYLGEGWGLGLGYVVAAGLRVELSFLSSRGSAARAGNASVTYRSSLASDHATVGLGHPFRLGWLTVRPGARVGASLTTGRTQLGAVTVRDARLFPIVGPSLALLVSISAVVVGVEGEAFFLPTWPAAPMGGAYAVVGLAF